MNANLSVYERFKPRGFWNVLKDKSLLIVAGIISAGVAFAYIYFLNWSGIGVATGMVGGSLVMEIIRLRDERRWLFHKIENLERRLKAEAS